MSQFKSWWFPILIGICLIVIGVYIGQKYFATPCSFEISSNTILQFKSMQSGEYIDEVQMSIFGMDTIIRGGILEIISDSIKEKILIFESQGFHSLSVNMGDANYLDSLTIYFESNSGNSPGLENPQIFMNYSRTSRPVSNFIIMEGGNFPNNPNINFFPSPYGYKRYVLLDRRIADLTFGYENFVNFDIRDVRDSIRLDVVLDDAVDMDGVPAEYLEAARRATAAATE